MEQASTFSRTSPSPRYRALVALYKEMHEHGEQAAGRPAEKTYAGMSCRPQAPHVKAMVEQYGARTILDYGSGKGRQYEPMEISDDDGRVFNDLQSYWGVESIHCYDPGFAKFSRLPEGKFDGVISTDVLEHCPEEDMPWILEEIFSYASRFVFANVACYPASKQLPTGENAHCTVRDAAWWKDLIGRIAARHPGVRYRFHFELREEAPAPRGLSRLLALVRKPEMEQRIITATSD
jgi:hypothetical protein